jgi:hypothetical protein
VERRDIPGVEISVIPADLQSDINLELDWYLKELSPTEIEIQIVFEEAEVISMSI